MISILTDSAPLLADISPQDVGEIIIALIASGCVGVGCYQSGKARATRIEPQPLVVKPHPDYATKDDLKRLAERQDVFEQEMRALMRDSETRTHNRLDTTNEKLSEIAGRQEMLLTNVNALLAHFIQKSFTPTKSHE